MMTVLLTDCSTPPASVENALDMPKMPPATKLLNVLLVYTAKAPTTLYLETAPNKFLKVAHVPQLGTVLTTSSATTQLAKSLVPSPLDPMYLALL
jgi:hypothetical protein